LWRHEKSHPKVALLKSWVDQPALCFLDFLCDLLFFFAISRWSVTEEAAETMLVADEGVAKLGVAVKARALMSTNKRLFMCET